MDDLAEIEQGRTGESLEQGRERFRHWREMRGRGEHLPRVLWIAAVDVARKHGLHITARELRVDYERLKKRLEQSSGARQASGMEMQFVELTLAPTPQAAAQNLSECVIELQSMRGAKMRVELNGPGLAGLVGLCSPFWSGA